jgi:hypothetical protein
MQAVKPEWATAYSRFEALSLDQQIALIISGLEAISSQAAGKGPGAAKTQERQMREVQRYVEWSVPALVPERAEAAEGLVNVARCIARWLVSSDPHIQVSAAEVEAQLGQLRELKATLTS